jgi:hypothetical protein
LANLYSAKISTIPEPERQPANQHKNKKNQDYRFGQKQYQTARVKSSIQKITRTASQYKKSKPDTTNKQYKIKKEPNPSHTSTVTGLNQPTETTGP